MNRVVHIKTPALPLSAQLRHLNLDPAGAESCISERKVGVYLEAATSIVVTNHETAHLGAPKELLSPRHSCSSISKGGQSCHILIIEH